MSDLILGPAGVLAPGVWARGSVLRAALGKECRLAPVQARARHGKRALAAGQIEPLLVEALCLDLTEGPLDPGTRALLALVAPEVEQPLTAPGWDWWSDRYSTSTAWTLTDSTDGEWLAVFVDPAGAMSGRYTVPLVPVAGLDAEHNRRRALALALHAAKEARDAVSANTGPAIPSAPPYQFSPNWLHSSINGRILTVSRYSGEVKYRAAPIGVVGVEGTDDELWSRAFALYAEKEARDE